jgi:hypothetical protein
MKLVGWMLLGSIGSSGILSFLLRAEIRQSLWLGMLGPLASAIVSWIAMERQHRRQPEGLTGLLIKAFAAKMLFFAAYLSVFLYAGWVQPIPFAVSLVGYFLALHIVEAFGLRRLQAAGVATPTETPSGPIRNG